MTRLHFYDSFYVHKELKYEFIAWVVTLTVYSLISGAAGQIIGDSKALINFYEIQWLIIAMMLLFHVWLLTKWTLNKLATLLTDKSLYLRRSDIDSIKLYDSTFFCLTTIFSLSCCFCFCLCYYSICFICFVIFSKLQTKIVEHQSTKKKKSVEEIQSKMKEIGLN